MATKRSLRTLAIGAGLLLLADEVVRPAGPDLRTVTGRRDLIARGDEIRELLERYRSRTGRYPLSLWQLGASLRWTDRAYGGWDYETRDGGRVYYLRIGGYVRYGFVLYRNSTAKEWSWDT